MLSYASENLKLSEGIILKKKHEKFLWKNDLMHQLFAL